MLVLFTQIYACTHLAGNTARTFDICLAVNIPVAMSYVLSIRIS